eukprot:jgi/Undpi1/11064/HiC_scaffold_30.g13362.m1
MADPASLQPVVQQQQSKDALLDVRRKLESISAEHKTFGTALTQSLDVVRRALEEFGVVAPGGRGGGGSLAISFNGGKDACVVLYLLLLVLAERDELDRLWATAGDNRIRVVYFEKEEFPEIEEFMRKVSDTYGFEFLKYAVSYKDGMRDLVDNYGVKGREATPLETRRCACRAGNTDRPTSLRKRKNTWSVTLGVRAAAVAAALNRVLAPAGEAGLRGGGEGGDGGGGSISGGGQGGGGGAGGSSCGAPPALKRVSAWDKGWNYLGKSDDDDVVLSKRVVSNGNGGKAEGSAEGPDRGAFFPGRIAETAGVPGNGGAAGGVPTRLSDCGLGMDPGSEVVEIEGRTCLQPDGKGHGLSAGWVGGSARWLPVTVVLALVLAAVGGRRSDSTRGGGESMAVEGNSS